jgi:hypothetical protein
MIWKSAQLVKHTDKSGQNKEKGWRQGKSTHTMEELLMYAAHDLCAEHPVVVISCSLEPRLRDHVGLGSLSKDV